MVEWHALHKEELFSILKTSDSGLSEQEASSRIKQYGHNEIKEILKIRPLLIFLEQFKSVFILILILAAIFSLFIKHYIDFFVIIIIVILNASIGFFQQYKAEKTIMELKNMLVPKVRVFRGNRLVEISSTNLVPGDILQLSEGDKIMADCRIIYSNQLQTNEAPLTGESFSQNKSSEILKEDIDLANRENMLYMGTTIVAGNAKAIVVLTGMNTEFGKIAGLVQKIKSEKTPLEKKLDSFSKKVAVAVLILAALSIAIGLLHGEEPYNMFLTGIALAISVIPEGVPAIIAITLAIAIGRMKKSNSLIRKLPAAETLGRTTVICTDKTGTLTEEKMVVTTLYAGRELYNIRDSLFYNHSKNKKIDPHNSSELKMLLKIGVLCNNARIEKDRNKIMNILGDPTEKALVVSADNAGISKQKETEKETRLIEYSFSSKRKLMSIIRKTKYGNLSYVKGSPEIILKACNREFINGRVIPLTQKRKEELIVVYENFAAQALRVLGFAYRVVPTRYDQKTAEEGLIFSGFQAMMDPPRKEVYQSIQDCLAAGIKIKMLTGDSLVTAEAVGRIIGLDGEKSSIEEHELQKLSEQEFNDIVKNKTIFARITPETKLRIIRTLKEQGEIVAVTGDGVNDVLALKEAHIGVAMGVRGSDVAREVADITLLDDNFSSIVNAVREGRRVYANLKKSITAHITANAGELFIVLFAILLFLPLPMLPLAILWMNLITDSLPSLALAFEPADKDIMKRKPISRKENILTGLWGFLLVSGLLCFLAAILLFIAYYPADMAKARTIVITTAIFCEMFVVFSCRSDKNIWKIGFFTNQFLVWSVAIAFVLQAIAIYSPLSLVFEFVPLSFLEILIILAASCPIFIVSEIWKFYKSKKTIL